MRIALLLVASVLVVAGLLFRSFPDPAARGATLIEAAEVLEAGRERPERAPPRQAEWSAARLPDNWDGRRPGYEGFVWYRIALPPAASIPLPDSASRRSGRQASSATTATLAENSRASAASSATLQLAVSASTCQAARSCRIRSSVEVPTEPVAPRRVIERIG